MTADKGVGAVQSFCMLIPASASCTCNHSSKQSISHTGEGNYTHKGTSVSGPGTRSQQVWETEAQQRLLQWMHIVWQGVKCQTEGPAAFKTTVVHLVCGRYLMLLAPVVRATPPFLPYRFRIYLACIIVYFDPGATNNGQHVRSWSLAFLLVSPQWVNPCIHSLAAPLLPSQGRVRPTCLGFEQGEFQYLAEKKHWCQDPLWDYVTGVKTEWPSQQLETWYRWHWNYFNLNMKYQNLLFSFFSLGTFRILASP